MGDFLHWTDGHRHFPNIDRFGSSSSSLTDTATPCCNSVTVAHDNFISRIVHHWLLEAPHFSPGVTEQAPVQRCGAGRYLQIPGAVGIGALQLKVSRVGFCITAMNTQTTQGYSSRALTSRLGRRATSSDASSCILIKEWSGLSRCCRPRQMRRPCLARFADTSVMHKVILEFRGT